MRHLFLAVPVLVAAWAAAPAAPLPADAVVPPPFPTAVGTKWVYRLAAEEWTEEVTAVERRGDATTATIRKVLRGGAWGETWRVEVSRYGVFRLDPAGPDAGPPRCLFQLPLRPGAEWAYTPPTGAARVRQLAAEPVTVPAGTYRAVPVVSVLQQTKPTHQEDIPAMTTTSWYAPGVGLVRQVAGDVETVLLSFTPGR